MAELYRQVKLQVCMGSDLVTNCFMREEIGRDNEWFQTLLSQCMRRTTTFKVTRVLAHSKDDVLVRYYQKR